MELVSGNAFNTLHPLTASQQKLTWGTPNGYKVSIMLEELGVPYKVTPIDINKDEADSDYHKKLPVFVACSGMA